MSRFSWRLLLGIACAVATVAACAELFCIVGFAGPPWLGIKGLTEAASGRPYLERISSVEPQGAAALAGVRAGDLVDVRQLHVIDRFGIIGQPLAGRSLALTVLRGHQKVPVTFVPRPDAGWSVFPNPDYFEAIAAIWLSLFAWLFALRGGDDPDGRLLTLTLVFSTLWIVTDPRNVAVPWVWGYALIALVFAISGPAAVALWAQFSSRFGPASSPLRRMLKNLCFSIGILAALVGLGYPLGAQTLLVDPVAVALAPVWTVPHLAQIITALLCALAAIGASEGVQRQRAAWTIVSLGLIYCVQPLTQYGQDVSTSFLEFLGFQATQGLALLLAPVGLTYGILSRRLFDLGFVFNRAAVFSGVSIVLVAAFVIVEWLLTDWLRGASHATSLAATAALALILGFSVRAVHSRVDRVIDSVLFRKRHEDELAIRAFALEAPYVTDEALLRERTVRLLEKHADSTFVQLALDDDNGRYGVVNENDPAILRLRATSAPVDLHGVESAFVGDLAYPIVARGRLIGVLVLGPRNTGEAYAPDESAAIAQLATSLGAALDVLRLTGRSTSDNALERIESLLRKVATRLDERDVGT